MLNLIKFFFLLIVGIVLNPYLYSQNENLWQVSHSGIVYDFHPDYFENIYTDPILGEFLCRPLIRYNLQKNNFDFPIIKSVHEHAQGTEWVWEFLIRTELSWGNGEAFTSDDLKVLLEEFWPSKIETKFGINLIANAKVVANDPHKLTIKWSKRPEIGPFVITRIPVMKPRDISKGLKAFHCVGRYKVDFSNEKETHLIAKAKLPSGYPKKIVLFTKAFEEPKTIRNYDLVLSFAADLDFSKKRLSDEPAKCDRTLLTPYLSLLTWNPKTQISSSSQLRRTLTSTIPRGELLRAGAAFLGELSTGLFSRNSPAYSKDAELLPFDILKASKNFELLGFKRLQAFGSRMEKDGATKVSLNISSTTEGFNLAKKIITDSFASLGINVNFIHTNQNSSDKDIHGRMESIFLDANYDYLLSFFDPSSDHKYPFFQIDNSNLHRLILKLKKSGGVSSLNLVDLTEIHNSLVDLELASVFFQHKICVQFDSNSRKFSNLLKLF